MNRILLTAIAAIAFASTAAFAAAEEEHKLSLYMTVLHGTEVVADSVINYHGMTANDIAFTMSKATPVLDVASKQQDKGGPYTMRLKQVTTDAKGAKEQPELEFQGLTIKGMAKILRAQSKVGGELIAATESEDAKGGDRAYGSKQKKDKGKKDRSERKEHDRGNSKK